MLFARLFKFKVLVQIFVLKNYKDFVLEILTISQQSLYNKDSQNISPKKGCIMYVSGLTDKGISREQNQDAIFFTKDKIGPLPNLFIVADGMGGHNAGEVASNLAIQFFSEYIRDFPAQEFVQQGDFLDLLVTAARKTNTKVFQHAQKDADFTGMGTTLTAGVITAEKALFIHVGDSRAYAIAKHNIAQITTDHTYIQEMIQTGQLTQDEAETHPNRHVLTRALGSQADIEVDGLIMELAAWENILICSDGLSNMLTDFEIMQVVNREGYVEHRTSALVELANANGGKDNISAVLIDIKR